FTTERPEGDYPLAFESYLFHHPNHLNLQFEGSYLEFYVVHTAHRKLLAHLPLFLKDQQAISGIRSPFGALLFDHKMDAQLLHAFVDFILWILKGRGIHSVTVKNICMGFQPEMVSKTINVLVNHGFRLKEAPINYHLSLEASFEQNLHLMEARKLKKCATYGFEFQCESIDQLEEFYGFIRSCRMSRNQPMNMSLEGLKDCLSVFPRHYQFYSLRDKGKLVAVTIIVVLNSRVVYNFLPASDMSYKSSSPMVALLYQIYQYFKKKGYGILDLGISEVDTNPQFGLLSFKQRIGGKASVKPTFTFTFAD
ncbi:GNAT family N-acetyltransferase, partial [Xanthovirga aplysinae]|uniref:GNAT family N-acetyltransferase n=1 Tax=Xanthovirga aplysinae TaxID=2529853 RepID=UPI0012BCDC9F